MFFLCRRRVSTRQAHSIPARRRLVPRRAVSIRAKTPIRTRLFFQSRSPISLHHIITTPVRTIILQHRFSPSRRPISTSASNSVQKYPILVNLFSNYSHHRRAQCRASVQWFFRPFARQTRTSIDTLADQSVFFPITRRRRFAERAAMRIARALAMVAI
jgi:hypothetical protein